MKDKEFYKKLDKMALDAYKTGWVFIDLPNGKCKMRPLNPGEKIDKFEQMIKEEK